MAITKDVSLTILKKTVIGWYVCSISFGDSAVLEDLSMVVMDVVVREALKVHHISVCELTAILLAFTICYRPLRLDSLAMAPFTGRVRVELGENGN